MSKLKEKLSDECEKRQIEKETFQNEVCKHLFSISVTLASIKLNKLFYLVMTTTESAVLIELYEKVLNTKFIVNCTNKTFENRQQTP